MSKHFTLPNTIDKFQLKKKQTDISPICGITDKQSRNVYQCVLLYDTYQYVYILIPVYVCLQPETEALKGY